MIWIAAVIFLALFCFFPKKMFIFSGAIVLIGGIGTLILLMPEILESRAEKKVDVTVSYSPSVCKEPYPLLVRITNMSKKIVTKVEWDIKVNKPGFSSDISNYGYHDYSQDKILKYKEGWQICFVVPKLKQKNGDYSKLEYSVINKSVRFK